MAGPGNSFLLASFQAGITEDRQHMRGLFKNSICKLLFCPGKEHNESIHSLPLAAIRESAAETFSSRDDTPWNHPFLSNDSLRRFRVYSDAVLSFAESYYQKSRASQMSIAFCVNMAQNMYKWGCLARKYGVDAQLFLHPHDASALSSPEWEEFDGEYSDLLNGDGFHTKYPDIHTRIGVHRPSLKDSSFYEAAALFARGQRKPLLQLIGGLSGFRYESLLSYTGVYAYFDWARQLNTFDVIYIASLPIAAYFSGRPYCYCPVGGDFQIDCGRGDDYGQLMSIAVNAARFTVFSNPHILGHSRRLGFTNGVHLPYPMDTVDRYCPGHGDSRREWEERYGKGVYIMTTSRLDKTAKGFQQDFVETILTLAGKRPNAKFVFLGWGEDVEWFGRRIAEARGDQNIIMLSPVGKTRIIDYYRSCDIVLDHFTYGYYGATALEAAAVGKPVVMNQRSEHYAPLYDGDVAPVINAKSVQELSTRILELIDDPELRRDKGKAMRDWIVRNHGEERTVPKMIALLRLAADSVRLPDEIAEMNPLSDTESEEEAAYHTSCVVPKPR